MTTRDELNKLKKDELSKLFKERNGKEPDSSLKKEDLVDLLVVEHVKPKEPIETPSVRYKIVFRKGGSQIVPEEHGKIYEAKLKMNPYHPRIAKVIKQELKEVIKEEFTEE